jgi:cytidylate kinase
MDKQWIISISREYGTGGHEIAEKISKAFGYPLYDRNLLEHVLGDDANVEDWRHCDEKPATFAFSQTLTGSKNSSEYSLAVRQFEYLKQKAESGESFVVVGRCSEHILKDYEGLIPIFVVGDDACKIKRVMEFRNFTEKEARSALNRHNRLRKRYHNSFCDGKWGDSRCYDLCINSSRLGVSGTAELLEHYIRCKMNQTS